MDEKYLKNGIEVVFAFENPQTTNVKHQIFLAGTTPWHSNLVYSSWRRWLIEKFKHNDSDMTGIVIYVPEPRMGEFPDNANGLTEWEIEYLEKSSIHAYWLNTYWNYENAIKNCNKQNHQYFTDGDEANIGITVRSEIGASLQRYKQDNRNFDLLIGAPADSELLEWIEVMTNLYGLPFYRLKDKNNIIDSNWINAINNLLK